MTINLRCIYTLDQSIFILIMNSDFSNLILRVQVCCAVFHYKYIDYYYYIGRVCLKSTRRLRFKIYIDF